MPLEDPFDIAYEQYNNLKTQKKYHEALELCNECIKNDIGVPYVSIL